VTFDRTSGASLGLAVVFHAGLALLLGSLVLRQQAPATMPLLIEVTLTGTSAPRSATEGVKSEGQVIAPQGEKEDETPSLTPEQLRVLQQQRRRRLSQELARSRNRLRIGATEQELRQASGGLAEGRGAGDFGQPGTPRGTLSLTGAIATRGFKEPDFSSLKSYITEETQLRLTLWVQPGGEVKRAALLETSGYPFVDQKAIELARKILFDPLPANWQQVDQEGVLTIKLKL
jgi:TonB family protein